MQLMLKVLVTGSLLIGFPFCPLKSSDIYIGAEGEGFEQEGTPWQPVSLITPEAECRALLPHPIHSKLESGNCSIYSDYKGCRYQLQTSLLQTFEAPSSALELESRLRHDPSLREGERCEIVVLAHGMPHVRYVVEKTVRNSMNKRLWVERIYCSDKGQLYHFWVLGDREPLYEVFETLQIFR